MKYLYALSAVTMLGVAMVSGAAEPQATAQDVSSVPATLATPSTQHLSNVFLGKGVQIYECRANATDAKQFAWAFVAPEADLFDAAGKKVAHHFAGPTWESVDGSKLVGVVTAKYSSPGQKAVPWLLLSAESSGTQGIFSQVKSIQRIDTVGGTAPDDGCNAEHAGAGVRVPYQAQYRFFK